MAQITKRRKLNVDDSPKEQFLALRQIVTLTQQDCREIVALLRNADSSKTCTKSKEVYFRCIALLEGTAGSSHRRRSHGCSLHVSRGLAAKES